MRFARYFCMINSKPRLIHPLFQSLLFSAAGYLISSSTSIGLEGESLRGPYVSSSTGSIHTSLECMSMSFVYFTPSRGQKYEAKLTSAVTQIHTYTQQCLRNFEASWLDDPCSMMIRSICLPIPATHSFSAAIFSSRFILSVPAFNFFLNQLARTGAAY